MTSHRSHESFPDSPPRETGPVWRRVAVKALALLLVMLMQGPATFVQELAWAGMLVNYTRSQGVVSGVKKTFDGEHPCALCKKAAELRRDEGAPQRDEKPMVELRSRHVWTEMLASGMFFLPGRKSRTLPDPAAGIRVWKPGGRAADAPPLPPPEWIG